jgi:Arc/MetJ-type ribon-helix-helix transcriptional regulator
MARNSGKKRVPRRSDAENARRADRLDSADGDSYAWGMAIHLTPEQERRIRSVMDRGAYDSVDEVVDAALTAVEQRTVPGFAGTPEQLDALLAEGLASKELSESEFWDSVEKQTADILAEQKSGNRP